MNNPEKVDIVLGWILVAGILVLVTYRCLTIRRGWIILVVTAASGLFVHRVTGGRYWSR